MYKPLHVYANARAKSNAAVLKPKLFHPKATATTITPNHLPHDAYERPRRDYASLSLALLSLSSCPTPQRARLHILLRPLPLALLARILTYRAVAHTSTLAPRELARALWTTLHAHPAQSSIGWDVVWTTIAFAVWARAWAAPVLSALVSIGVVGPAVGVGMGA
ncbi:hypothetical protein EVG20_g2147 [Dentipellis fragilis]|uniref:Uncharacterized protein n=1 Tax=Dentipellis fragilis TaxID=205917 RepID=A0A4Y9ZAL0_9AGAM|nr:hypothetical protein EVG20_g2147 [Dentipellis fragilis]